MLSFFISGAQIKHLKTVLQCLNKIGTELLLEATSSKLKLQAINTSKSAFFAVTFHPTFFDSFTTGSAQVVQSGVLLKHVLAALKTSRVTRMQMDVDPQACQIVICLESQNGLVKRYRLESIQSDILDANLDREAFPITVVAEAAELGRLLSTFQHSQEEITLIANPDAPEHTGPWNHACQLQSFLDPKKARSSSSLQTSMTVDAHSVFRHYSHRAEETCDVTFNLRDLRAMVALCEHMQANVTIRFERCGVPLLVEPHFHEAVHPGYSAELILATLVESQIGAAMPMPHDMFAQQPPDQIGQQHEPVPQPPQRQGLDVNQGNNRGIVCFNNTGTDEQAGFEGVEAEEELMMQEAGIQPWVEPSADGLHGETTMAEVVRARGHDLGRASPVPSAPHGMLPRSGAGIGVGAQEKSGRLEARNGGGAGSEGMRCREAGGLGGGLGASVVGGMGAGSSAPTLAPHSRACLAPSPPGAQQQQKNARVAPAKPPLQQPLQPSAPANASYDLGTGRPGNLAGPSGSIGGAGTNQPGSVGGLGNSIGQEGTNLPGSLGGLDVNQPSGSAGLHNMGGVGDGGGDGGANQTGNLPGTSFFSPPRPSWRADVGAPGRLGSTNPQPQAHASGMSGQQAGAAVEMPLMHIDDPEHLPGARSPFHNRGHSAQQQLPLDAYEARCNPSSVQAQGSLLPHSSSRTTAPSNAHMHVYTHSVTASHTSPSHATNPSHIPSRVGSLYQAPGSVQAPQAACIGRAGQPQATTSTLHSPTHAAQPAGAVNSGPQHVGAIGRMSGMGNAAGRASGSVTFPQLGGASVLGGGSGRTPYLPVGQITDAGSKGLSSVAHLGMGVGQVGSLAAAPGYQQYMHHQQQQQQQQRQQAFGDGMGGMEHDDDVLPGTPEDEQPANLNDGPSIIGMGGRS